MFSVCRPRAVATEWREAGEDGASAGDATAGAAAAGAAASGAGGGAQPAAAQQESRWVGWFLHSAVLLQLGQGLYLYSHTKIFSLYVKINHNVT